jgi:Fe2+ or Zn2+ uptake regulation protein
MLVATDVCKHEEIFISLKRNGFDISLLEVEEILNKLVEEGFIQREMPQREIPESVTGSLLRLSHS